MAYFERIQFGLLLGLDFCARVNCIWNACNEQVVFESALLILLGFLRLIYKHGISNSHLMNAIHIIVILKTNRTDLYCFSSDE